ncbi:OsmC family protein [Saccharopolyspora phatthalungensis]|uniref:Putative OsmC-like protein n=1 Tax=Saccharopolyspora phatthalungensis TaxID=664693 RepID=A0A840QH73_9PSEU|nr:OsmC family protein [Saccharopolyspora phatthalungensis]MBB5159481.1 putative OsmC-like protein [Saccharopolyspora phatthalungensis]
MTNAQDRITAVSGTLTATEGRFLLSAGANHFVSDARTGPGEAVTAGQLFISAAVSCALTNVYLHGRELGADLTGALVTAQSERDPEDPTRYRSVELSVSLPHVRKAAAQEIVHRFTSTCPIYNTIRRGGNIEVTLLTQE